MRVTPAVWAQRLHAPTRAHTRLHDISSAHTRGIQKKKNCGYIQLLICCYFMDLAN